MKRRPVRKPAPRGRSKRARKPRVAARPKPSKPTPPKKEEYFTPEQVAAALVKSRGFVSATARALGCNPSTVRDYMDRYPEVKTARFEAKEGLKDFAEVGLLRRMEKGDTTAHIFFLKTQAKDRGYIEKSEVEVTNPEEVARAIHDALSAMEAASDPKVAVA